MRRILVVSAVLCLSILAVSQQHASPAIKLDQVGYLTSARKVAAVTAAAEAFSVKRVSDGKSVFEGRLSPAAKDADTGDSVQTADFSKLKAAGTYYIEVPGVGRSWQFSIGPDVFSRTYYLAMRAFYGQRCGTAVDLGPDFPGYRYPACHLKGAFHPSSGKDGAYDDPGGWHDAGDYGRYIPSSAVTVASLLLTQELYGGKTDRISLKIPESGNGTPDLLNEARWNLGWMLRMQDKDGGVWHKQTSRGFAGFVMPEDDQSVSEVVGTGSAPYKSTCATADLAAVAAMAARIYKPYDPKFAARNLEAARAAWKWALANPNVTFKNPEGVHTGMYPDQQCGDEILWAAAELWRATGESEFNRYFAGNYAKFLDKMQAPPPENWAEMSPFAAWAWLLSGRKGADAKALTEVRKAVVDGADQIVARTRSNPYRTSMRARDYVWGSNSVAAQYGVQLLITNRIAPNPAYVEAAADNLHYLLGRNTFSVSWVSQVGENPFRHPHHRPSQADKLPEPWPGLVSGGPNADQVDLLKRLPAHTPPAKVWEDNWELAAANEVAINWQGVLVFLLAGQLQ